MSKRVYEKRNREDQEATAHVFQDFIKSFQDMPPSATSKTFVKSEILYTDKNILKPLANNQIYKPTPLIKNEDFLKSALECAKIVKETNFNDLRKNKQKPKSNLELLKEELKQRHAEQEDRDKLRNEIALMAPPALSYFEGGDPNSTNLFVANLKTNITENHLMEEFGAYGPLASVKIMWPRGEDKFKNTNTNCGFVAYMSRKDAERALKTMKNRTDMRVGWGKSVELPTHPVYIPNELLKLYLPPPRSGLPFNAQIISNKKNSSSEDIKEILQNATVKVTIPLNKKTLAIIHRMVEFVVKEGPLFEAMIMNNEIQNSDYNFLFENKSPAHIYYRWKLFSVLQGDATREWRKEPFKMFEEGSVWIPPKAPDYSAGMPEDLLSIKNPMVILSEAQSDQLIELIQNLNLKRFSIAEAMIFCLNNSSAINDSLDIIVDSLLNSATKPQKKIARFYLLSDILSNCVKLNINFRKSNINIDSIMCDLRKCLLSISGEHDKIIFESKIYRILKQLKLIGFLTLEDGQKYESYLNIESLSSTEDDGNSSNEEPLDEVNLLKRSLKNSCDEYSIITPVSFNSTQEPYEETRTNKQIMQQYFVPSKWDVLDPEDVDSQAMTSSKLYYINTDIENKYEKSPRNKCESRKRKAQKSNFSPERNPVKRRNSNKMKNRN